MTPEETIDRPAAIETARSVAAELAAAAPEASRSLTLSWQDPLATAAEGPASSSPPPPRPA